jgi:hypothetical protein
LRPGIEVADAVPGARHVLEVKDDELETLERIGYGSEARPHGFVIKLVTATPKEPGGDRRFAARVLDCHVTMAAGKS